MVNQGSPISLQGTWLQGLLPKPFTTVHKKYIHIFVYVYTHIYTHIHIHRYPHTYTHRYPHTYIHIYVYTYIDAYIYTYIAQIYICTYLHICIYIIYIHTYIYNIHTYFVNGREPAVGTESEPQWPWSKWKYADALICNPIQSTGQGIRSIFCFALPHHWKIRSQPRGRPTSNDMLSDTGLKSTPVTARANWLLPADRQCWSSAWAKQRAEIRDRWSLSGAALPEFWWGSSTHGKCTWLDEASLEAGLEAMEIAMDAVEIGAKQTLG